MIGGQARSTHTKTSTHKHKIKAFYTVSRDGLWKIPARLDCPPPPQFLTILRQLHECQKGQVNHNGSLSGNFPISEGIKQDAFWPPHRFPSSSASCSVRQKRTCQTASIFVSEQTAVSSTFGISSHARKPSRSSQLSCYLLTTAPSRPHGGSLTAQRQPLL